MYVQKYSFNTADPVMRVLWDELCSRKIVEGCTAPSCPLQSPRLTGLNITWCRWATTG